MRLHSDCEAKGGKDSAGSLAGKIYNDHIIRFMQACLNKTTMVLRTTILKKMKTTSLTMMMTNSLYF
jgi:hypothetical protein